MSNQFDELLSIVGGPPREALDRLIYVVGSARGGTSITQAIIAQHENVIAMQGPSSFLNHVWRYRYKVHERLWRQLLWTPHYLRRALVRDSLGGERQDAFTKLINVAVLEKELRDVYRLYPLVRALDPEESRRPEAMTAWLDKGNDFWGVKLLPQAFPHGRFVFVMRDPRGAVASLSKRFADLRADSELNVEPVDIITTAIYWRNLVRQQMRFARNYADRTVLFRFEDLTTRPVEMVGVLYDAVGLPPVSLGKIRSNLEGSLYHASIDAGDRGKGISTAPNERWKSRLTPQEISLISEICGPSARALGYDLPEPEKRLGWSGLLSHVTGLKAKLKVLAKLVFLAIMEGPASWPKSAAPLPLLAVE